MRMRVRAHASGHGIMESGADAVLQAVGNFALH